MGGVAACYGQSIPVLALAMGYARKLANIDTNFNSNQTIKTFSKSFESIHIAAEIYNIFLHACTNLKKGCRGPVIV